MLSPYDGWLKCSHLAYQIRTFPSIQQRADLCRTLIVGPQYPYLPFSFFSFANRIPGGDNLVLTFQPLLHSRWPCDPVLVNDTQEDICSAHSEQAWLFRLMGHDWFHPSSHPLSSGTSRGYLRVQQPPLNDKRNSQCTEYREHEGRLDL